MLEFHESELPESLKKIVEGDFLYKMTSLLKDNPAYLSNVILELDRLIEEPESERQDMFKEILGKIEQNMPKEEKIIII
ncbi:hypothetical protein ACI2KR_07035 [Pseudomonas luteola]